VFLGDPVVLAAIVALALASSSSDSPKREPTPLNGPLQGLFTYHDYPAQALDRDEQGTVRVVLRIDSSGAIAACMIKQSSGSDLLDKRTCDVIRRRAHFEPALDRRGRRVASTLTQSVEWRIAEDLFPSEPWVSRSILTLSADRKPMACRFEYEGALATPGHSSQSCSVEGVNANAPILREIPEGSEIVDEQRFEIGTEPGANELKPGDTLIQRIVLDLKIDAYGKQQSCTVIAATATASPQDPCAAMQKSYKPRTGPTGEYKAFDATLTLLEYARPRTAAAH
jgi:TonB family protein